MKPIVSVILPTYNRAHLLARTVRSVLAQTCSNWELIIVDDGSSDATASLVAGFDDSRIQYVRHETNRGAPAARNTGIRLARGEYLAFIDSDNEWLPTKLAKQLAVFEHTTLSSLAVVTCGMRVIGPRGESIGMPCKKGRIFDDLLRRRVGVWDTNTFLVRRQGTEQFLFDEEMPAYQDFDYLACVAREYEIDYVDEVLVNSYEDDHGPHVSDHNLEGRLRILDKYASALKARPETLSHHHVRIGTLYYYRNNMRLARKHLLRAACVYPIRVNHWIWLAAACLGKWAVWFSVRAFPHDTLH